MPVVKQDQVPEDYRKICEQQQAKIDKQHALIVEAETTRRSLLAEIEDLRAAMQPTKDSIRILDAQFRDELFKRHQAEFVNKQLLKMYRRALHGQAEFAFKNSLLILESETLQFRIKHDANIRSGNA